MPKRASGLAKEESGTTICHCTLERWHARQDCAHVRMSAFRDSKWRRDVRLPSLLDGRGNVENRITLRLKDCGTNGRGTPVEMSQRSLVVKAGSCTSSNLREGEDWTVARSGSSARALAIYSIYSLVCCEGIYLDP